MSLPTAIREDFQELARLIGSLTDAHSVALFLPTELLTSGSMPHQAAPNSRPDLRDTIPLKQVVQPGIDIKAGSIDLVAVYSYSKLVRDCRIQIGSGLLGWVADQGRPIHLAPCEVGSSAIGIYVDNEPIKSLAAVPIFTHRPGTSIDGNACGVLMCDSLRPDGFTNAHVKILEQMAAHIQRLLIWVRQMVQGSQLETSWDIFKQKCRELGEAIGHDSIELLRVKLDTLHELETKGGLTPAVQLAEQFLRLAQQSLPPHFPIVRLPHGDIVIALDNMMSGFFQQKLQSLAQHLHSQERPLSISLESYRAALTLGGQCNIDATLQQQPVSRKVSGTDHKSSLVTRGTR
ncbi:MAG: GAF domain-containing protein [Pseudomonadota bacterium]|jgi:hypothetical protein